MEQQHSGWWGTHPLLILAHGLRVKVFCQPRFRKFKLKVIKTFCSMCDTVKQHRSGNIFGRRANPSSGIFGWRAFIKNRQQKRHHVIRSNALFGAGPIRRCLGPWLICSDVTWQPFHLEPHASVSSPTTKHPPTPSNPVARNSTIPSPLLLTHSKYRMCVVAGEFAQ